MGDAGVQENRWLVLGPEPPKEYRDAKGDLLETLGPIARINLFVGANNAGKSRLMMAILRSPRDRFGRLYTPPTLFDRLVEEDEGTAPEPAVKYLYIPCLRTAHPLQAATTTDEVLRNTAQFNFQLPPEVEIHTGAAVSVKVQDAPNSGYVEDARLKDFANLLRRRFFGGLELKVFARTPDPGNPAKLRLEVTVHWPGTTDEHPIHGYGDGINNLIVLLYPAFMAPPGSWIFIEEPENSLHPGLQRAFMQALLEEDQLASHRFFLTTHSNHLVEHTLRCDDLSVFSFRPRFRKADARWSREFVVEQVGGYGHSLLAELGVTNASVLLANCTVWVEGITDRLYLRTYLRCYEKHLEDAGTLKKRLLEDLHYAFFEFAGSNVEHYAFGAEDDDAAAEKIRAQFVSNRIFLLHDKDGPGGPDDEGKRAKRFARLEREAATANKDAPGRFKFHKTAGVEIENEIGPNLLLAVLDDFLGRMRSRPTVTDAHRAELAKDGYANTPLGEHLTNVLGLTEEQATFRGGNKDGRPGTLDNEYKLHLADLVAKHATWDNIGPRAQDLAREVHAWIEAQNP